MTLDIIFMVALSFTVMFIQFGAIDHLTEVMRIGGEMTGGLANIYNQTDSVSSGMMAMQNNALLQYHLGQVVMYLALLVLAAFVLWIVIEGISWFVSYTIAVNKEKRLKFWIYLKNFAIQTIPFYLLYVLWLVLLIVFMMRMSTTMFPVLSLGTLNNIFGILAIITAYFAFFSYTLTRRKSLVNIRDAFKYGVLKFPALWAPVLFIVILIVVVDLILRIPFITQDPVYLLAFGAVLFLPAVTFSRILLFKTRQEILPIKNVKRKKK
jgi:hypothetical protein